MANMKPLSAARWAELTQSVFEGDTVYNEAIMFLEAGEKRPLLYQIDRVLSVKSSDGQTTYTEGVDYAVEDGQIVCLPGGSIPVITAEVFYGADDQSFLKCKYNGEERYTYWGEGDTMLKWQIAVTYTHSDTWTGFLQPGGAQYYEKFLKKLEAGQDVTILFHGDSITYGWSATSLTDRGTEYLPTYPILFTEKLARTYGYGIRYIKGEPENTPPVPADEAGTRGTITYINTAVGGWNSKHGVDEYDTYIRPYVDKYGCDLFVYGYGMNDGGRDIDTICDNQRITVMRVVQQAPDVSVVLLATMVPNPEAINGWYGNQELQEAAYLCAAAHFRAAGIPCNVCRMRSTSLAILKRKLFRDTTGNNINHPNDFYVRIYADTLWRSVAQ